MKFITSRQLAVMIILLALTLSAAAPNRPLASTLNFSFEVGSDFNARQTFSFQVKEPGCILAQIKSWSPAEVGGEAATELALILNGPDRKGSYARNDGSASSLLPLWTSYAVTADEITSEEEWTISVVNFTEKGTAKGNIVLEIPPTKVPCQLQAAVPRTKREIDLSWLYTSSLSTGSFLVEQSTDDLTWQVICTQRPTASTGYACSATRLTSGVRYYYRTCFVFSGSKCSTIDLTPALSVKAP